MSPSNTLRIRKIMRTVRRWHINTAILLAMIVAMGMAWLARESAARTVERARLVGESQAVLASASSVLAELGQSVTAQRNYILTAEGRYRDELSNAMVRTQAELSQLRAFGSDANRAASVAAISTLVARRVALLGEAVEVFEDQGFAAARQVISAGTGGEVMEGLRQQLAVLERAEHVHILQQFGESEQSARQTDRAILASALFSVLLLGLMMLLIEHDLRHRRAADAELRAAERAADAANRAKTEFLATVSHEIRTPLNAVLGMTELLRDTRLTSEQHEFARTVHTNAESLLNLVSDLLDSSKIEAGQVDLEFIPFDVRDLIEGVAEVMAVRAEARDLDLVLAIELDVPPILIGDSNRLRQILLNLVGNAIKFTEEGSVTIAADARPLENGDYELRIEVTDTGIGIAPQDRERIFDPFTQAETSTTRRFGGTGLGLNIVRSLTHILGGTIALDSEPGRGSTFRLTLPLPQHGEPAMPPAAEFAGARIMVLSNNATRRTSVTRLLEARGASVQDASGVREALGALAVDAFDIAIFDERTEDLQGVLSLLPRVARAEPKVILLIALHSPFVGEHSDSAGYACVFKPVRHARLLEEVRVALGEPRAGPPSIDAVPAVMPPPGSRPRVLVADDNADNAAFVLRTLTAGGYDVEVVSNGAEAVREASRFCYDLVLMDIEMPLMDGFDAAAGIRAAEHGCGERPTPIVALTAHATNVFRERCLAGGMDDYATKPITSAQLVQLAARWIDVRPLVIVADDSPDNQVIIRSYLKHEGYRLHFVEDGAAAVEACRRFRVALLLLDMDMPVLDGYAAAHQIRRGLGLATLPIIAMTGYTGSAEQRKCLTAGCSGYVPKPIRRSDLVRTVRDALVAVATAGSYAVALPREAATVSALYPLRERHNRIARMISRHDSEAAVPLVARSRFELQSLSLPMLEKLAGELASALAEGDDGAATLWNDRLLAATRETRRLNVIRGSGLLDGSPDAALDRITNLVASTLNVPVAVVTIVETDRQIFKSFVGVDEPWASLRGTPISHSFCQHVVASEAQFVVPDARLDPLVRDNPAVADLGVIAYAGVPLTLPGGIVVGSLCAIDTEPHAWTPTELATLIALRHDAEVEIARLAGYAPNTADARSRDAAAGAEPADMPDDALNDSSFATRFLEGRAAEVRAVGDWLDAGDLAAAARLGHQLKGSASLFGFPEIGAIAASLESAALAGDTTAAARHAQALRARFEFDSAGSGNAA
jgi:signal transduction histidine kinase/CheY-like chemotaxis protein